MHAKKLFRRIFRRSRRQRYEEHARRPEVQDLISSARRSWYERYGVDPAAKRLERVKKR